MMGWCHSVFLVRHHMKILDNEDIWMPMQIFALNTDPNIRVLAAAAILDLVKLIATVLFKVLITRS